MGLWSPVIRGAVVGGGKTVLVMRRSKAHRFSAEGSIAVITIAMFPPAHFFNFIS